MGLNVTLQITALECELQGAITEKTSKHYKHQMKKYDKR